MLSKADLLETEFQAADAARVNQNASDNMVDPHQTDQTSNQPEACSSSQEMVTTETQNTQYAADQIQDDSSHEHQHATGQANSAGGVAVQVGAEQTSSHVFGGNPDLKHQEGHSQKVEDTNPNLSEHPEAPEDNVLGLNAKDDRSVKEVSLSAAAHAALLLPNAIRISSVTQFGIQHLQQDVTKLLARHQEAGK